MSIKGQSCNQVNIDPRVIDKQNDTMLESISNIVHDNKSFALQCQTLIGGMEGDIKSPYQELFEQIQYKSSIVEKDMSFRIRKNKKFVQDMRKTQVR